MSSEQTSHHLVQPPSALYRMAADFWRNLRATASGRFTERQEFQVFRRSCDDDPVFTPPPGIEVRRFDNPADLRLLADQGYDLGPAFEQTDALAPVLPGGKLYALFENRRLTHFSRSMADRRDHNFGPYLPGIGTDTDICIGPCYTHPDFRGRGLYATALNRICADAGAEGVGHAYIYCAVSNAASIKGILKAGFEPVARVVRRRVLLWNRSTAIPDRDKDNP